MTFSKDVEVIRISGIKGRGKFSPKKYNGYYKRVRSRYEHVENPKLTLISYQKPYSTEWILSGIKQFRICNARINTNSRCPTKVGEWCCGSFHVQNQLVAEMKVERFELDKTLILLKGTFGSHDIHYLILQFLVDISPLKRSL
eukprot:UN23764